MSLGELWRQITTALSNGVLPDLGAWSYVILVLLVFVEGPAATLVAATMATTGILHADLVFLLSHREFFGRRFLVPGWLVSRARWACTLPWLQRRMAAIESVEQVLHGRAAQMYLLTKVSLGLLTIPVLIASGLTRVPWLRLFVVSIVVEPLWNGMLVLAGYRLGDSVAHMERGLRIAAIVGSVLVFLALLLLYRRMFKRLFEMVKGDPQ